MKGIDGNMALSRICKGVEAGWSEVVPFVARGASYETHLRHADAAVPLLEPCENEIREPSAENRSTVTDAGTMSEPGRRQASQKLGRT
jgi:hypothetical protein